MRPPESVLIVSPDATTLQSLTRALMRSGLPVVPALGWAEGEVRLRRIPVSVVVADMEGLSADELAKVRRLRSSFPNVGVIALVSLAWPEVPAAETQGLLLAVLGKPVALGHLEEILRAALARTGMEGRRERP